MNLGGRRLTMNRLATLFAELKFTDVSTFIASGNVIFKSASKDEAALRAKIEKHLHAALGYQVETFLRTSDEIAALAAVTPFPTETLGEEPKLHVGFLHTTLALADAKKITGLKTDVDELVVIGHEFYWLCRVGTLESTVGNLLLTKSAKVPINTMRNMNTVRRLVAKYGF